MEDEPIESKIKTSFKGEPKSTSIAKTRFLPKIIPNIESNGNSYFSIILSSI